MSIPSSPLSHGVMGEVWSCSCEVDGEGEGDREREREVLHPYLRLLLTEVSALFQSAVGLDGAGSQTSEVAATWG